MAFAKRRFKRSKKNLSENGKNKSNFRYNEVETDFQSTVSSAYNKDKMRAYRFEADDEMKNWLIKEQRKK